MYPVKKGWQPAKMQGFGALHPARMGQRGPTSTATQLLGATVMLGILGLLLYEIIYPR